MRGHAQNHGLSHKERLPLRRVHIIGGFRPLGCISIGENKKPAHLRACCGGSERHRSADLTIFSRSLYQLSYRAMNRRNRSSVPATPAGLEPVTSAVTGRRSNQLSYGAICTSMKHKRIYYSITGPRRAARRVAPRQCQAHPLPLQAIATPAIPALPIPWWAVVWRGFDRYADRAAQA